MSATPDTHDSLTKGLGFIHVFCLASGAMISSGIFILPGLAFAQAGPAVVISYLLAGLLALVGIMSVAELATAMPKAGGDFYFVTRSLGPMAGTVAGLLSWFALSLKTAFAIFGIAELLHIVTGWPILLIAAPVCLFFTVLNIIGVREAARFEVALVACLLILMAAFFSTGIGKIDGENFRPWAPHGANAVFYTAGFVFVSFGGLLNIATVAEEVKNPTRNIPLAFISSVLVITVAYAAVLYVTVGLLPAAELENSLTPIADAARVATGQAGFIAISIAALLAFVTTANAGIMAASRYPLALSRDNLLPPRFSAVSRRLGTPVTAIVVTGLVIFASLLLNLELLVKAASTVVLTTYVLASLAVIVLRHSGLQNYRPTFTVPGYPWLPGLGIVLFVFLIVDMGAATIEISLGLVFTGLLVYLFYGRRHCDQDYALLHVIERMISRELSSYSLESELKDILLQRGTVVQDPLDEVLQQAAVLDIENSCDRECLFEQAANCLAQEVPITSEEIYSLLCQRESESSTALSDFLAVPHLVMPGEGLFKVLIVRCRSGIQWTESHPAVKAVFVICGTRDQRNLHLKALAAIAHIAQQSTFETQWMRFRHSAQLRDIMLISDRKRHYVTPVSD